MPEAIAAHYLRFQRQASHLHCDTLADPVLLIFLLLMSLNFLLLLLGFRCLDLLLFLIGLVLIFIGFPHHAPLHSLLGFLRLLLYSALSCRVPNIKFNVAKVLQSLIPILQQPVRKFLALFPVSLIWAHLTRCWNS